MSPNIIIPYPATRALANINLSEIVLWLKQKYQMELFSQAYNSLNTATGINPNKPKFDVGIKDICEHLIYNGLFDLNLIRNYMIITANPTVINGVPCMDENSIFNLLDVFISGSGGLNDWFREIQNNLELDEEEVEVLGINKTQGYLMMYYAVPFQLDTVPMRMYTMDLMMCLINAMVNSNVETYRILLESGKNYFSQLITFEGTDDILYYPRHYLSPEGLMEVIKDPNTNVSNFMNMNCFVAMDYTDIELI